MQVRESELPLGALLESSRSATLRLRTPSPAQPSPADLSTTQSSKNQAEPAKPSPAQLFMRQDSLIIMTFQLSKRKDSLLACRSFSSSSSSLSHCLTRSISSSALRSFSQLKCSLHSFLERLDKRNRIYELQSMAGLYAAYPSKCAPSCLDNRHRIYELQGYSPYQRASQCRGGSSLLNSLKGHKTYADP